MFAPGYNRKFILLSILFWPLLVQAENGRPAGPITLTLNATEISRQLLHAQLSLPVNSGPLTLAYPKWIPGDHAPTGPIDSLVGLKLWANGEPLPWHRDLVEVYLIHCDVSAAVLLWLEADTIIRQRTGGSKSLDDFCHLFHGGQSGGPTVKTYTFDEVVTDLNQVCAFDWASFWLQRLNSLSPHAPLGGIEAGGWSLTYTDQPNEVIKTRDKREKQTDESFSIGLLGQRRWNRQ
jgi:hypothetical protein